MILGFTGHREVNDKTYDCLYKFIDNLKPSKIITGMAIGSDQIVAKIAIDLNIPFVAAIPFENQEQMWNKIQKLEYLDLLNYAQDKVIVSPGGFANFKYLKRNEFIVKNSDQMLAYYDGRTTGGTFHCVEFAKKFNKKIDIVYV